MTNLNKLKMKEKFLSTIETVDESSVIEYLEKNTENLDLYTYFVTNDAFCTGEIPLPDIQDLIHKIYADWYYLSKNNSKFRLDTHKLLYNNKYAPSVMSKKECYALVRSNEYRDILPVVVQAINDINDGFYTVIRTDKLYGIYEDVELMARLYINMPSKNVLDFTREFLDRCYLQNLPVLYKFFSSDVRSDNVVIYADYEYAEMVVKTIEEINADYPSLLEGAGDVNPLLGRVNDYIGFGEQPLGSTYFQSRTDALSSIKRVASNQVLKESLVAKEQKIIFRTDGRNYTPTEYLMFLIEKNAIAIIDNKINELENSSDKTSVVKLKKLYALRENVAKYIDIGVETNKLKKSITRNEKYSLDLNLVNRLTKDSNLELFDSKDKLDYDYINKLYNVFSTDDEKLIGRGSEDSKKKLIADKIFTPTDEFLNTNTRDFLFGFFKNELSIILKQVLNKTMDETKYQKRSSVLSNLKLKECALLKKLIKAILNDEDEGRDLVDRCIDDYIRILSTGALEDVEIYVLGKKIDIASDIGKEILSRFPELKQKIEALTRNRVFIDNVLISYGINKDNMSVNNSTKNYSKKRSHKVAVQYNRYPYYNKQHFEYVR